MDRCLQGTVTEFVVAIDRLCCFGFEFVKMDFQNRRCKIVVHSSYEEIQDGTKELSDDMFAIITVFVTKNNGKRSAKKIEREEQEKQNKRSSKRQKTNPTPL